LDEPLLDFIIILSGAIPNESEFTYYAFSFRPSRLYAEMAFEELKEGPFKVRLSLRLFVTPGLTKDENFQPKKLNTDALGYSLPTATQHPSFNTA
jgi:hypothetical protein